MRLLTSITEVNPNEPIIGAGDVFSYGLQMMLIGMATVFAALIIIWVALIGFKYLFANLGNSNSQNKEKQEQHETVPVYTHTTMQDAELVAVIAAAIAEAESQGNGAKFRVVSFRRK